MQQQSDDAMKANSKTAEENIVITSRLSSFWNEFFQQELIYHESKETFGHFSMTLKISFHDKVISMRPSLSLFYIVVCDNDAGLQFIHTIPQMLNLKTTKG